MADPLECMTVEQLIAEARRLQAEDSGLHRHVEELEQRLGEATRQLQFLQESHRDLYELSPVAQMGLTPSAKIEEANATCSCLLACPKDRLLGRLFLDFVAEVDRPKFLEHMRQCETQTGEINVELTLLPEKGQAVPVLLTSEPREIETSSGRRKITRRVCRIAITRLTRHDQVEEDLRASEERLKLAQAAGGIGSWDLNLLTRELRWSPEQYMLLGLEPGSVRPSYQVWRSCLHPEDRASISSATLCREDVSTVGLEYRVVLPGGRIRWLSSRGKVLRDRLGRRLRMIGATIDITESKETHQRLEELNQALIDRTHEAEQRSGELRALAAQLTQAENRERRRLALLLHDHLQQLLVAARMKLGVVKNTLQAGRLGSLVGQTGELIEQAIAASRSLSVELSPPMLFESGLAAALEWLAHQTREMHGLAVQVRATDEPEDEDIRFFLFQCVRELLLNTVKHAGVDQAFVTMDRYDDDRVIITVSDRGKGADLERLRQEWSAATSFGLLSIHERLKLLGGRFEIETAPGQGMRASLIAPVRKPGARRMNELVPQPKPAQPSVASADPIEKEGPGPAGSINILLANPPSIVGRQITTLLESEPDLKIIAQAHDSRTAIEAALNLPVDIALVDWSLPSMEAVEATRRMLAERPQMVVIGLSFEHDQAAAEAMQSAGAVALLREDEVKSKLIQAIRRFAPREKSFIPQGR